MIHYFDDNFALKYANYRFIPNYRYLRYFPDTEHFISSREQHWHVKYWKKHKEDDILNKFKTIEDINNYYKTEIKNIEKFLKKHSEIFIGRMKSKIEIPNY